MRWRIKMGYETSYWGGIKLKSKKAINILKKLIKEEKEPFVDMGDIEVKKSDLSINSYGKYDSEDMLKVCLFVANLDKESFGEIDCEGEENLDVWKIIIRDGKVSTKQGNIVYDEDGKVFDDIETKKKVYDITKDKDLLKEIIVESLN